jgi:hypothetical protein
MKQTTSQTLFAYWNEVRGSRIAPRRFDIEPARLSPVLTQTFILERVSSEVYTYRLAGTRICEHFGTELRGTDFLDGWPEQDAVTIARQLAGPCSAGAGLVLQAEACTDNTLEGVRFEILILPLIHTGNAVTRYVGVMSPIEPPIGSA